MLSKIRIANLLKMKQEKKKIVMITAYDFPTGSLADQAEVDMILVGDSLGNSVLGFEDTIPVRLEHMIHHTAAVRRGVERALLVGDMPFMTYHVSPEEALRNAGRLIQEGGAEAVKLEGARSVAASIRRIVDTGIPVMGHIGLTPQSIHALSGYRVQGRGEDDARRLMEEAKILEDAGCFSIVLECVTWEVAEEITNSLSIPTIGIGSGGGCDGQVLVLNDMIGLDQRKPPSFVKQYAQVGRSIKKALRGYAAEVREGTYPDRGHAFFSAPRKKIDPAEIRDFARTEKPADEDENRNG